MSISVHCDECDKTYQLRDEMAGRKGKCPQGHTLYVPAPVASPAPAEENEFAFDAPSRVSTRKDPPSSKPVKKRPEPRPAEPAANDDEFAFPTATASRDRDEPEAPKSSRRRTSSQPAQAARKSMMPLIVGGALAMLGIGGGAAMFFVSRAEVNPLREEAAAANKRAAEADQKMKTAEAVAAAANVDLASLKNLASTSETALKEAKAKTAAAEKQVASLKQKNKELEDAKGETMTPAVGKNDPAAPKGDAPKTPDAGPAGGKNWTVPATVMIDLFSHKPGDRLWLWPKDDASLKAIGGKLKIRFRYELRKGKELPTEALATVFIFEAGAVKISTIRVNLTGVKGDAEATFDVKGLTGTANIIYFLSDGNLDAKGTKMMAFSNFIATQAEF